MSSVEQERDYGFFEETDDDTKIGEIDACERFITKCWEKHRLRCFQEKRLSQALKDALGLDKALILFTYVENDRFSEDICLLLKQQKIKELIREHFDVLGWDVSDNITQDSGCLPEAIASAFQDKSVVKELTAVVEERKSAFYVVCEFLSEIRLYRINTAVSQGSFQELLGILVELKRVTKEMRYFLFAKMMAQSKPSNSKEFHASIFNAFNLGFKGTYQLFDCRNTKSLKKAIGYFIYWKENFTSKEYQAIADVCKNIIRSSKYSMVKDMVEISFIFNCIEMEVEGQKVMKPYPVFVLKKCKDSKHPCRIFVDHAGRVYETWEDYLGNNQFPSCTMVLPKNGVYQLGKDGSVQLEPHERKVGRVLSIADDVTKIALLATTLVFPCPLVAIPTALYLLVRNLWMLFDRWMHSQDMSFWNAEARSSYLYVVGCTFTIGYIAKVLAQAAQICKEVLFLSNDSYLLRLVPGVVVGHDVGVKVHKWIQSQDFKKMCENVDTLEKSLSKLCVGVEKSTRICDEFREALKKVCAVDLPEEVVKCRAEISQLQFSSAKEEKSCQTCGGFYLNV